MSWKSLSERLGTLPQVLAGPMLRKVTPTSVTVWFALRSPALVKLTVFESTPPQSTLFTGSRHTYAVGKNLHIVAVTADQLAPTKTAGTTLVENAVYLYDATFEFDTSPPGSMSLGVATQGVRLAYTPNYQFPSFCLPPKDLNRLRIIHGSCRKPSGNGLDAFAMLDDLIAQTATTPLQRPQQLLLTGDQIYADDVAASFLLLLTDAATVLLGWDEVLPLPAPFGSKAASALPPFSRRPVLKAAVGFTSEDLDSHLMSLGEYLCMYLFVWSPVLWPTDPNVPDIGDVMLASQGFYEVPIPEKQYNSILGDIRSLASFRPALGDIRRTLANISTYTIFDDHDVTDDWNMTEYTAYHLHATDIGQRVVQNALVAYCLCQHWGNVPEQFLKADSTLPGTRLLGKLDGITSSNDYANKSSDIRALVSVPVAADVEKNLRVDHPAGSLTYNYTIEGSAHQIIVTDTRTWRVYPGVGGLHPDFLGPSQFAAQIVATPDLRGRMLIVVLSTNAPPVQCIRTVSTGPLFKKVANRSKHFPDVNEAWELPSVGFDRLIKALSDKVGFSGGVSGKIMLLSGDVHTGFTSRLHYKATKRFEDSGTQHANVVIAQLVASGFKKQDEDTLGQQKQGYHYAPFLKAAIPPHITEYYLGWNVQPSFRNFGRWLGNFLPLKSGRSVRLPWYVDSRPEVTITGPLPANLDSFAIPPDFSYQLDYLQMINGGTVLTPKPLPVLPKPNTPGGPTEDELEEVAHLHELASGNYRQHNRDPAVIREVIGVNNFGDITFSLPPAGQTGPLIVNHRLRFRDAFGERLFVDYAVNMETQDSAHLPDPVFAKYVKP